MQLGKSIYEIRLITSRNLSLNLSRKFVELGVMKTDPYAVVTVIPVKIVFETNTFEKVKAIRFSDNSRYVVDTSLFEYYWKAPKTGNVSVSDSHTVLQIVACKMEHELFISIAT